MTDDEDNQRAAPEGAIAPGSAPQVVKMVCRMPDVRSGELQHPGAGSRHTLQAQPLSMLHMAAAGRRCAFAVIALLRLIDAYRSASHPLLPNYPEKMPLAGDRNPLRPRQVDTLEHRVQVDHELLVRAHAPDPAGRLFSSYTPERRLLVLERAHLQDMRYCATPRGECLVDHTAGGAPW